MPCLVARLAHEGAGVVDGQGEIEGSHLQLHAPGLYLGEIENLVDQG